MVLNPLSGDLIIEIFCKLKKKNIIVIYSNKKLFQVYSNYTNHVLKGIINSYNYIYTDQSNIQFLINGNDIDAKALRNSVKRNRCKDLEFLIKNGINVSINQEEALRFAGTFNYIKIAKLLIKGGANLHICDDNPLRFAVVNGQIELVKLLIKYGADIHACNDQALQWAVIGEHLEVVKLLLEKGAYVNNEFLHYAKSKNMIDIVDVLTVAIEMGQS